jgi:hypothetical protein
MAHPDLMDLAVAVAVEAMQTTLRDAVVLVLSLLGT